MQMQSPDSSLTVSIALSWAESKQPESRFSLNEFSDEHISHATAH